MVKQRRDTVISARVPRNLKRTISKIVEGGSHLNESGFVREALRQKIQRDALDLYKQLHGGGKSK